MSIAALVLGILSIALPYLLCFLLGINNVIGIALGVTGIVLAVMAAKKEPEKKGLRIAGLVLSIIGTALSGFGLIAWLVCAAAVTSAAQGLNTAAQSLNSEDAQKAVDALQKAADALKQ